MANVERNRVTWLAYQLGRANEVSRFIQNHQIGSEDMKTEVCIYYMWERLDIANQLSSSVLMVGLLFRGPICNRKIKSVHYNFEKRIEIQGGNF